jgi:hypothetical protein
VVSLGQATFSNLSDGQGSKPHKGLTTRKGSRYNVYVSEQIFVPAVSTPLLHTQAAPSGCARTHTPCSFRLSLVPRCLESLFLIFPFNSGCVGASCHIDFCIYILLMFLAACTLTHRLCGYSDGAWNRQQTRRVNNSRLR